MNAATQMAAWSLGLANAGPSVGACGCSAVSGLTVDAAEIMSLDGQIQEFNTDVLNESSQTSTPSTIGLVLSWNAFFSRWTTWRIAHTSFLEQTAIPVLGNPEVGPEFEAFVSEYNERLRQWKAAGLPTHASKNHAGQTILDRATDVVGTAGTVAIIGGLAWVLFTVYNAAKGR